MKTIKVTYDKAGVSVIEVKSNKSIIGIGSKGVIRGKGLRMANGVKNVIIQYVASICLTYFPDITQKHSHYRAQSTIHLGRRCDYPSRH